MQQDFSKTLTSREWVPDTLQSWEGEDNKGVGPTSVTPLPLQIGSLISKRATFKREINTSNALQDKKEKNYSNNLL